MTHAHTGRYPNLDGLRGVAIALVFLHHLAGDLPDTTLAHNGRYGVTLFFVLSGFLITSLLLRARHDGGTTSAGGFLVRRFARIAPAYFAVLALYVVAIAVVGMFDPTNRALFADKLPLLATFTSNWHERATDGPFFVAWSLGVEVQFYLAMALLVWLRKLRWAALLAALVIAARVGAEALHPGAAAPVALRGVEESIWIGVLAAAIAARPAVARALERLRSPWLAGALTVTFVGVLATVELPHKHGLDTLALGLLAALAIAIAAHSPRIPLLSSRWLDYLGERSYGLYLGHMLAILVARQLTAAPWSTPLALALAVVGAEILYRAVERPGANLIRRWADAPRARAAVAWPTSAARSNEP